MPSSILQQRTGPRGRAQESPRGPRKAPRAAGAVALHYRSELARVHRGRLPAAGAAELTGHTWTGAVADVYWLALSPTPVSPPPGLRGPFLRGVVTQVPDGVPPCGLP